MSKRKSGQPSTKIDLKRQRASQEKEEEKEHWKRWQDAPLMSKEMSEDYWEAFCETAKEPDICFEEAFGWKPSASYSMKMKPDLYVNVQNGPVLKWMLDKLPNQTLFLLIYIYADSIQLLYEVDSKQNSVGLAIVQSFNWYSPPGLFLEMKAFAGALLRQQLQINRPSLAIVKELSSFLENGANDDHVSLLLVDVIHPFTLFSWQAPNVGVPLPVFLAGRRYDQWTERATSLVSTRAHQCFYDSFQSHLLLNTTLLPPLIDVVREYLCLSPYIKNHWFQLIDIPAMKNHLTVWMSLIGAPVRGERFIHLTLLHAQRWNLLLQKQEEETEIWQFLAQWSFEHWCHFGYRAPSSVQRLLPTIKLDALLVDDALRRRRPIFMIENEELLPSFREAFVQVVLQRKESHLFFETVRTNANETGLLLANPYFSFKMRMDIIKSNPVACRSVPLHILIEQLLSDRFKLPSHNGYLWVHVYFLLCLLQHYEPGVKDWKDPKLMQLWKSIIETIDHYIQWKRAAADRFSFQALQELTTAHLTAATALRQIVEECLHGSFNVDRLLKTYLSSHRPALQVQIWRDAQAPAKKDAPFMPDYSCVSDYTHERNYQVIRGLETHDRVMVVEFSVLCRFEPDSRSSHKHADGYWFEDPGHFSRPIADTVRIRDENDHHEIAWLADHVDVHDTRQPCRPLYFRPGAKEFLEKASSKFHVIIASTRHVALVLYMLHLLQSNMKRTSIVRWTIPEIRDHLLPCHTNSSVFVAEYVLAPGETIDSQVRTLPPITLTEKEKKVKDDNGALEKIWKSV